MCKISLAPKITSADNIHTSAEGHKTNSMAGAVSGIRSTIDAMPANSRNMRALPADSTLNHSAKLIDNAKKALSQQINELTKTGNPSYEIKAALFQQYAISLMKAQLNDNAIDDQTLIKYFTNTNALDGKIQRFSDQIDSFKQQKLGSAKAAHLQEAFRVIEESIETLFLLNSPLDKSEPEPTTSSGLKQPAARSNEVDGHIPADEPATSYIPTGSGNSYYNCHFGDKIERIATDAASPSINITVNVNGKEVTASSEVIANKNAPQQASTSSLESENTESSEQGSQLIAKEIPVENKASITGTASSQITLSKHANDDLLADDAVDGSSLMDNTVMGEQESDKTVRTEVAEVLEEPSSTTLPQEPESEKQYSSPSPPPLPKSNFVTDSGKYTRVGEEKWELKDQPFAPLFRSQSEPALHTVDTGGYKKGADGKWTKEKLHSKTDVVLSQGATQSNNIAGKKAYSLSDVRGNDMDRANEAKAGNTLTVDLNINMDDNGNVEPEIQGVNISVSPEKSSFSLNRRSVGQQSSLKRSFSANDVQTADSSNINKLTGQPFKYSVSVDDRVILTRDAQVQSLSRKNSYIEGDTRFGAKTDKASS